MALWQGRFDEEPAAALWDFTVDLGVDSQLWPYDVAVNRAHARMLGDCGVLDAATVAAVLGALDTVESEFEAGEFEWAPGDEDVHMAIERRLTELVGAAGASVHAARSRNDQVATDFKLWCRDGATRLGHAADALVTTLCDIAVAHAGDLAPGYTHLQRAQPLTLGHALLAHAAALERDAARFADARARNAESALGAGALATTTLPIDPAATAAALGFERPFLNSIDAVASRDFALELLAAATICAGTLSRLAEEVVLWASEEFAVLRLADAWATGSSMMPQKKNPDVAELARAVPGRVLGAFVSLQTVVKGLPLAYNRDLQEDKAATFAALRRLELALVAMRGLLAASSFDVERLAAAAGGGGAAATDLAEALVAAGVAFRDAHELVGSLVGRLAGEGRTLESVTAAELAAVHPSLAGCAGDWLSPRACVERRAVPGGPHPDSVLRAAATLTGRVAGRTW
ncbi:MAG: argininosuccinate lyase [Acidimicrobiia bacterium]|nr:argininosuccinate lyase [Acidimicrobiia bacterium]